MLRSIAYALSCVSDIVLAVYDLLDLLRGDG
jgi:hypothetical protein